MKLPDDEQAEQQLLLETAMEACVPPAEQPGAAMPALKEAFRQAWDEADAAGQIKIVKKSQRPRQDRSTSSSRAGGAESASNPYNTDVSAAASESSTPGKYHHTLDQFWFKRDVSQRFKEIFASSISSMTAKHYNSHVKAWLSHCTSENWNPLNPSISQIIDYLAVRSKFSG